MNHNPICYIVGALPLPHHFTASPQAGDLIIAADRGYTHLDGRGIVPDIIVGDFDSSPTPHRPNVITLPMEKDDTDVGYAIRLGLERNYKHFVLLGCFGGLFDHTMANIQHLHSLSQQNCKAILLGDSQCATVITGGSLTLPGHQGHRCSIFALGGETSGVTLKNLYYPLDNAPLSPLFPLGVSNSFTSLPAQISVGCGSLLVVWDWRENPIQTFFKKEC